MKKPMMRKKPMAKKGKKYSSKMDEGMSNMGMGMTRKRKSKKSMGEMY